MRIWQHWGSGVRPKQFLFFSADVVGSTQLKQTMVLDADGLPINDETQSQWFGLIQDFYIQISELVLRNFEAATECYGAAADCPNYISAMKAPRVWKTIGDEVLFWVEVTDSRQVEQYIGIWISSIRDLRDALKEEYKVKDLNWKCTAWMANFPWRNKMLFSFIGDVSKSKNEHVVETYSYLVNQYFLRDDPPKGMMLDFVGPGIDLGFRLTAMSSARRFTISADVAYVLACTTLARHRTGKNGKSDLTVPARMAEPTAGGRGEKTPLVGGQRIHFDGLKTLKGVHGGRDYPHFWIDMMPTSSIEDYGRDLVVRPPCSSDNIASFAKTFYDNRKSYVYPPFIVSKTEEILTERPDWYDVRHIAMLRKDGFQGVGSPI